VSDEPSEKPVLVVDDDPDVRKSLAEALADRGWIVVAEPNGKTAMEHLRQGLTPCAILLDLMMPIMDGWQFREELRQDPSLATIPVLVISAFSPKPPAGYSALQDAPFIPKPFEIETVIRAIRRVCMTQPLN
jgi:CheY-like chemotaxis protein